MLKFFFATILFNITFFKILKKKKKKFLFLFYYIFYITFIEIKKTNYI